MKHPPCARRWSNATALAATLVVAVGHTKADNPDAAEDAGREILAKVLEAHGGLERFRSFGSLTYHTEGLPYSAAAPLDFDHTADLVARWHHMAGRSAKGAFVAGAKDNEGWTTDSDALGIPPHWVNHGNSYFVLMPFVFADAGTRIQSVGQRIHNGESHVALAVSFERGTGETSDDDYVLYIEPKTHRLRLIDFKVTYGPMRGDTPLDQLPRRSLEFVKWQEVDGLLIPAVLHYAPWERTSDGGRRKEDGVRYTVTEADFDGERPDAELFDAPEGAVVE